MWPSQLWVCAVVFLSLTGLHHASIPPRESKSVQTSVLLSPPFYLQPGSVVNKYLFDIPFPRGHIALKSFDAEVVDDKGVPIPLHETYLHHWVVARYYSKKNSRDDTLNSKFILVSNSGVCKGTLGQYFGLGSETRKTSTWVPGPYGIEVGNPNEIPNGYEERWLLNIHAIDTRGVKDRAGCTECKCSLYNVSEDEFGQPLTKDYVGGLRCCYDMTQCELRQGFSNPRITRKLYLRYTVQWIPWREAIAPVKIYILDVTDTGKTLASSSVQRTRSSCKVEYQVDQCNGGVPEDECVHTKKARIIMPRGGDIVYGVSHQHAGGIGSSLYGEDGRVLCTSMPTYGQGEEAGNEDGYIVGMSTCYPKPGAVKVADGELLTLESNYSSARMHTGVMGLFYILVAEPRPQQESGAIFLGLTSPWRGELVSEFWWVFLFAGVIVVVVVGAIVSYARKDGEGYRAIAT